MDLKGEDILLQAFPDGTKVTFACNIGYTSAGGSAVITCTAGSWSPVRLICESEYWHLIFPFKFLVAAIFLKLASSK